MVCDLLRETMQAQLLRYACGARIFCPICDRVLDAPKAVLLKDPATAICCSCWDKYVKQYRTELAVDPQWGESAFQERLDSILDVDGRTINWDFA